MVQGKYHVSEGIGVVLESCVRSPAWCFAAGYVGKQSTSTQVFRRYMGAEVDYFISYSL